MNKKFAVLLMATVFALGSVSFSFAGKLKCTVDAVDGDKVTMTCKKADQLKAGDKVKVSAKKKAAVEGC